MRFSRIITDYLLTQNPYLHLCLHLLKYPAVAHSRELQQDISEFAPIRHSHIKPVRVPITYSCNCIENIYQMNKLLVLMKNANNDRKNFR